MKAGRYFGCCYYCRMTMVTETPSAWFAWLFDSAVAASG